MFFCWHIWSWNPFSIAFGLCSVLQRVTHSLHCQEASFPVGQATSTRISWRICLFETSVHYMSIPSCSQRLFRSLLLTRLKIFIFQSFVQHNSSLSHYCPWMKLTVINTVLGTQHSRWDPLVLTPDINWHHTSINAEVDSLLPSKQHVTLLVYTV